MLLSALPFLGRFLTSKSVVVHTYAAVGIEKLIMVRIFRVLSSY